MDQTDLQTDGCQGLTTQLPFFLAAIEQPDKLIKNDAWKGKSASWNSQVFFESVCLCVHVSSSGGSLFPLRCKANISDYPNWNMALP